MKKFIILVSYTLTFLCSFSQVNWEGKKAPDVLVDKWVNRGTYQQTVSIGKVFSDNSIDYIILEFWFADCAPCLGQIPLMNNIVTEFPNVRVLSITFQDEDKINPVLQKVDLNYPVGIDKNQNTISAYGVVGYPSTFIIDRNGIVIWQDENHFQSLNTSYLKEILNNQKPVVPIPGHPTENNQPQINYTFTIEHHKFNMGKGNSSECGPFLINLVNQDLKYMLKTFWKINSPRVICDDPDLLKTKYDLTLQANRDIPIENNCIEAIKWILPEKLGVKVKSFFKDTVLYDLQLTEDSLLKAHISGRKFYGDAHNLAQPGDSIPTIWVAKGATLENLKNFIENQFNLLVKVEKQDTLRYNFTLSLVSFTETEKLLHDKYGIKLMPSRGKTEMFRIIKEGQ
ncbi:MAG: peroxiredoxin family protein [Mangrovibacterium sp.]